MEHSARKLAAIASIIVVLTMAFVPVADASTGAELKSPVTEDGDAPEYELLLATALFFVGLFAAGAITGYVASELLDSSVSDEDNAGNQEAVDQAFRKTESEKMTFAADTAKNIIATVLPADAELWFFTGDYWQKTIEYVVCDTWFKDNNGYDDYMNDIMVGTGLQTNAANYLYTWGAAIDNSYNNIFDYYADQISPNNYASGISVSLDYGSGSYDITEAAGDFYTDFCQIAKPSGSLTHVYIDTEDELYDEKNYCNTLYVFGDSGATIRYVGPAANGVSTGQTFTLNKGVNDLTGRGMPSGVYALENGHAYAGRIVPMSTANGASVYGGMVVNDKGNLNYFMPNADDTTLTMYSAENAVTSNSISNISLSVEYNGPQGTKTTSSVILGTSGDQHYNLVAQYDDLVQQIATVAYNTHVVGEATWGIFDKAEESSSVVKPSSIVINIPDVKLTATDYQGIYISAMKQMADYLDGNEEDFDGWTVNKESIGLYCYGTVMRDGKVWAENVVFTPYITTSDQHLQIGTNTWGGSGFGMVWAQVENYSEWDGTASLTRYQQLDLEEGDTIIIEKMVKEGKEVTEIDLTRAQIQKWNTGSDPGQAVGDEEIAVLDAQVLMIFIIVELGMILFLLGTVTGIRLLSIIGIIVAIVGLLWPQVFTSLLLGDFVWGDLKPFAWL